MTEALVREDDYRTAWRELSEVKSGSKLAKLFDALFFFFFLIRDERERWTRGGIRRMPINKCQLLDVLFWTARGRVAGRRRQAAGSRKQEAAGQSGVLMVRCMYDVCTMLAAGRATCERLMADACSDSSRYPKRLAGEGGNSR